ncbi:MAG: hypothetical protein ACI4K9_01245 [Candidatus Fimenecus sp.]
MVNGEKNSKEDITKSQTANRENGDFDLFIADGMDSLKRKPNYEKMRDEAIAQYLKERRKSRIYLFIGILLLIFSLCFFFGIGQHPLILIAAVCVFLSAWWLVDTVKQFPELKRRYRYRLSRAVEIMSNDNVFMEIPKEDLERFDKWYR